MSTISTKEHRAFHRVTFVRGATSHTGFPAEQNPFVLVTGRSNCGKSSLLNALVGRKDIARVSKTPGRTTEANFFDVDGRFFLVDLPGYGFAAAAQEKRSDWEGVALELFADSRTALALLLLDVRREPDERDEMLVECARRDGRTLRYVLTKRDKIGRGEFSRIISGWRLRFGGIDDLPLIVTSSRTGEGIAELAGVIESHVALSAASPPTNEKG